MINYIKNEIAENIGINDKLLKNDEFIELMATVGELCVAAYKNGNKIMICGNGGSSGDALHFVGELVGRYRKERKGLEAICLNANEINLTAIGNDYGYDEVFSRQVAACGKRGDIFIGISTSGNSENINKAFIEAKSAEITTVGLLGKNGGAAKELCDYSLVVPSDTTSHIQEAHILILHTIAGIIENGIFG